jgi:hypothetical protein
MSSNGYILSRQALGVTASHGPGYATLPSTREPPGMTAEGGRKVLAREDQTGWKIPRVHGRCDRRRTGTIYFLSIVLSLVGGPSPLARSVGGISDMGCMASQPFAVRGNRSYLDFWAVIDDPWYLWY